MREDVNNEMRRLKLITEMKPNFAELAREKGCDYRTAKNHYYAGEATSKKRKRKESLLEEEHKKIIADKFLTYSATASAIYSFIKKHHNYKGGYGLVKNYIKTIRELKKKKATVRFETKPGIQAQVDWKEQFKLCNKGGEGFCVNIYLYTLGYSRYKKCILTFDRRQDTLFNALKESFESTGGVPRDIYFDNMKTVVDEPKTSTAEAVINSKMKQFAKDTGFNVLACRAFRAQTKGKVESLAKLVDRLLVYNKEFNVMEELQIIVKEFNEEINNEICSATNKRPYELLEQEREFLLPLPSKEILDSYITKKVYRKVNKESFVQYKGNKYSVDPKYIGNYLEIKLVDKELCIYNNTELVRVHQVSEIKYNYAKDDLKEILKSDAFKYREDDEIDSYIKENLSDMDMILVK